MGDQPHFIKCHKQQEDQALPQAMKKLMIQQSVKLVTYNNVMFCLLNICCVKNFFFQLHLHRMILCMDEFKK